MQDHLVKIVSIIGAGRLATALALVLSEKGWKAALVASRTSASARQLAERLPDTPAYSLDELTEIPESVVLISVSDDAISGVAERLSAVTGDWADRVVLHTSGTWPSSVLKPLEIAGAATGSFHPVQTFTETFTELSDTAASTALFSNLPIAIEGDEAAVSTAFSIAETLGADPFQITSESKSLFHAAAVMSSNYLVTLLSLAEELSAIATGNNPAQRNYFTALAVKAVRNATEKGSRAALTGPIARGDMRVLEEHLSRMSVRAPHLVPVFAALATETVQMAESAQSISHEVADSMLATIAAQLDAYSNSVSST